MSFVWLDFYGRRENFWPRFVGCATFEKYQCKKIEGRARYIILHFFLGSGTNVCVTEEKIYIIIMKSFDRNSVCSAHQIMSIYILLAASNKLVPKAAAIRTDFNDVAGAGDDGDDDVMATTALALTAAYYCQSFNRSHSSINS